MVKVRIVRGIIVSACTMRVWLAHQFPEKWMPLSTIFTRDNRDSIFREFLDDNPKLVQTLADKIGFHIFVWPKEHKLWSKNYVIGVDNGIFNLTEDVVKIRSNICCDKELKAQCRNQNIHGSIVDLVMPME